MHHNVDVAEAVKSLIKTIGIACGGDAGQFQTQIGKTIGQCQTQFVGNKNPNALGKLVQGGYVEISLRGSEQPEAARVLDNVIGQALHEAKINLQEWKVKENAARRHAVNDPTTGQATGRVIKFVVPDDKAAAFAGALNEIDQIISRSGSLSQQCHKGVLCSQDVINQVEGLTTKGEIKEGAIKPFVELAIPARHEASSSGLARQACFVLHLEGVPNGMAAQIDSIRGVTDQRQPSKNRYSRGMKHEFTGGVDISIPINDPRFDEVIDAIKHYKPPHTKRGEAAPQLGALH
ncbi:MAG: hypothetical protein SFW63_00010 [Alphaproteobacteria bacterium]|nr:hypothetical protein [Alphaproteobacteria bacterium]